MEGRRLVKNKLCGEGCGLFYVAWLGVFLLVRDLKKVKGWVMDIFREEYFRRGRVNIKENVWEVIKRLVFWRRVNEGGWY